MRIKMFNALLQYYYRKHSSESNASNFVEVFKRHKENSIDEGIHFNLLFILC